MVTSILLVLCVVAQVADLLTWLVMDPSRELNPLVRALGPYAVVPKASLTVFLACLPALGGRGAPIRVALALGATMGIIGALSNLPR